MIWFDWFLVLNATFRNISAISWRPVLVMEEAGVPGENHRPWANNWETLSLATASRVHTFCNLQSRARTHAVLVIGLYKFLGNYLAHWATRPLQKIEERGHTIQWPTEKDKRMNNDLQNTMFSVITWIQ